MKDLYTIQQGKRRNIDEAVNEFLDNEIPEFKKGLNIAQASEKSLATMGFKMVSDEVQQVHALDRDTNMLVPMLLVAIAKLDSKFYGAYYYPKKKKRYAEEIKVDFMFDVIESVLIEDKNEWLVVSNYFNLNNVFENARIVDWYVRYRSDQALDLKETIQKMQWFQRAQKHQAKKGKKEFTPEEVIRLMPTASQVTGMKGRLVIPQHRK